MDPRHLIVLAVDGLRATSLGAYGGAVATPEIDRFAARSILYDWCYADAPELDRAYASLLPGITSLSRDRHATLLDDGSLPIDHQAAGVNEVEVFPTAAVDTPAETIADTWLAARFGEFADSLNRVRQRPGPQLVWMHTEGFFAAWDAPTGLVDTMLDEEEDSPIDPSVIPPTGRVSAEDPDAPFRASCRYAAQLKVLDACFGGLVEVIDELFADEPYRLALLGVRGYALGEHGVIGPDDRLYSESLHVPLIVSDSNGAGAMSRVAPPLGASSTAAALTSNPSSPWPKAIRQGSSSGATAIQQGEWRLVMPGGQNAVAELYLKPDDRWEANDVASLMPDVVTEMQPMLAAPVAVAASGDSK